MTKDKLPTYVTLITNPYSIILSEVAQIHILDSTGEIERTISFSEAERKL